MVVSESESEVLSDSESQPMREHQLPTEGALDSAQELNIKKELIQSDVERKELELKLLKKGKESNGEGHNPELVTECKNPEKNEDDLNRPLVLEERHSLSIAETKKRRASIYSNELLFIPKELARSELQQRTRTLSRYAKNRDYHLRMLKFPVGSGRPRYVAEQMKKAQACDQPNSIEALDESQMGVDDVTIKQEAGINDEVPEEIQDSNDSPQNMPDLEVEGGIQNQLPNDEEISNILFDLVKKEVEDNEALEEINRKILQSQRQSVIRTNTSRLQHYPYLPWRNPDPELLDSKTRCLQLPCKVETQPEVPESYNEFPFCGNLMDVSADFNQMEVQVEGVPGQEVKQEALIPDEQQYPLQSQFQNTETINYFPQCEAVLEMHLQEAEVPANNSTAAAPISPDMGGQSTNSALRQQLMHHIVQPDTFSEELLQSRSCNNNAADRINQNLGQPQFLETTLPHEIGSQWNPPGVESYADQAFHKQQLHLQQQYLYTQQYQQQQQQQQLMLYHQHQQHQHKIENKAQEMRVMYQRIKFREKEHLHQYGKSLKKIQEERLACERRHAEEKRMFLLHMDQSRKQEEKLKSEKEQLLRQLRSDLRALELRIADTQRQHEEMAMAWSWQHQQRPQFPAHTQQQQQAHFEVAQGQYIPSQSQPSQEPYPQHHQIVNQPHTMLYDAPPYVYQPGYQDSNGYPQRLQPYGDQLPSNPAEPHTVAIRDSALEMPRRLLLPPPPYCPTSNRIPSRPSLSSRKIRQRRLTTDHRSEPYAVPVRAPPPPSAPPQAEYLPFPINPQIGLSTESSQDLRGNHLEITSVMANYIENFMNRRAER